jgi:hypothetical protein
MLQHNIGESAQRKCGGTAMLTSDELAKQVTTAAASELDDALARIKHCLDQLTDSQVWQRPGAGQNSIANLLLHLSGNLRQHLVIGLGGGMDDRNRPQEFADDSGRPKGELLARLEATVGDVKRVLALQTPDDFLRIRRIQHHEISGIGAIFDSVPHFRGHTQEITFRTRLLLGEKYRFAWVPKTKEEGA